METTTAAPGPVAPDLPVLEALLVLIKIVDLLALADVALVERFRAGFFGDAADGRAGVPLRAALREVRGGALRAGTSTSRCEVRASRRGVLASKTFELLAGLGLRLYFHFCGC